MRSPNRPFTQEFKVAAVKLWEASGRKNNEVGEQFGMSPLLFSIYFSLVKFDGGFIIN